MTKNKLFMQLALFSAFMLIGTIVKAQLKVGNNPTTINANSVLEIESTNKGLLLPRLGLSSTISFSPLAAHVAGMTVYNTATAGDVTPGFYYNDGTKWVRLLSGASGGGAQNTTAGPLVTITNGAGATMTAMSVAVDTTALKSFIANNMSQSFIKDSLTTVINNQISGGSITGKDLINANGIIVTGGTGTTLKATSLRLDSTAVAKMVSQSPVKDSVASIVNNVINTGTGITGKTATAGSLITVTNGSGATLKDMTVSADTTALKSFVNGRTTNTLTGTGNALTSTINGVVAILTPASGTIASGSTLGFDAGGNLVKGSVSAFDSTTASNGLTLSGKDVKLGGSLTAATALTTSASNTLSLLGLQNSVASTDSILVVDATGVVKKRSIASILDRDLNVSTQTGNYTATATDDIIVYNGSTGAQTLTLPTTGIPVGKKIYVVNISNQDWNISPTPITGTVCQSTVGTLLMYTGSGWATVNAY